MMLLEYSSLYLALLAIMHVSLTLITGGGRLQNGYLEIGTGLDDKAFVRKIRAHGNFTEQVPIAALLIVALELQGVKSGIVHGLFIALILGRALHAVAVLHRSQLAPPRAMGMMLTLGPILVAAVLNLVSFIGQQNDSTPLS